MSPGAESVSKPFPALCVPLLDTGPGVVQGTTTANGISVSFDGKTQSTATFTPNCSQLLWNASNPYHNFGTMWCRGWQPGCNVIPPPYGRGLQFNGVFGSNMVLQRGPQKSAVYGVIAMGASGSEKPNVTVTVDNNAGKVYTLQTTLNSTTQPFGPGWEYPWPWKGPFQTWKALLPPTPAGGNYTIIAECSNCMNLDSEFVRTNITNVTFGDVIYCSGQSNMWLPLFNTFSRNETLRNITQVGKYRNIRIMAGNSGAQGSNYAGSQFNPWMTSLQAANVPSKGNEPLLFQFGAACWYTAQKLSDLLEASNQLVPLGLADTAIGGEGRSAAGGRGGSARRRGCVRHGWCHRCDPGLALLRSGVSPSFRWRVLLVPSQVSASRSTA